MNFEPEDPTTIYVQGGCKTIPFGSTLAPRALRVRLDRGRVCLTLPNGMPLDLSALPKWEMKELLEHVEFAVETGML